MQNQLVQENLFDEYDRIVPTFSGTLFNVKSTKFGEVYDIRSNSVFIKSTLTSSKKHSIDSSILQIVYSQDFFKRLFNDCLYWLPNTPIEIGATWIHQITLDINKPVSIHGIFTLEKMENGIALIRSNSLLNKTIDDEFSNIQINCVLQLEVNSGMLLDGEVHINIDGNVNLTNNKLKYVASFKKVIARLSKII